MRMRPTAKSLAWFESQLQKIEMIPYVMAGKSDVSRDGFTALQHKLGHLTIVGLFNMTERKLCILQGDELREVIQ